MAEQIANQVENKNYGWSNGLIVALLAAILVTQVLILVRMPAPFPTFGALRKIESSDERVKLIESLPLVRVHGGTLSADVTGSVEIDGSVDVKIQNTPLGVEIYR